MVGKKLILFLFFIFGIGLSVFGQTYSYTYVDPCTGIPNTIQLSSASGTVTMFYGGQYRTFTFTELQQGAYDTWVSSINAQVPTGSNPCAGNAGPVTNNFNNILANSMTGNITNITNIVSMAASLGGSMSGAASTAGGVSSTTSTNSDSDNNNSNSNNNTNNSGNSVGSNSGGSGNSGGSNSGGSGSNGGGNSGGSGNTGGGNSGESGSTGGGNSGGSGSTGGNGGQTSGGSDQPNQGGALGEINSTSASGGSTESSGGGGKKSKSERISRGALIGAADLVIIRNDSLITKSGNDNVKINSSLTHVNTKQTIIKGVNVNYQTGVSILNLTLYGSYKKKNLMLIGSNSSMYNFKRDWFNTTSILASQKASKVTLMAGTNYTFGQMGKGNFGNWSIIGGGFTNFKGGKSFGANLMLLGVYSPYVFYYDGQWYKSGILFIPLINTDFKLTDKFKWSISFAGTYQINSNILNYQIATGTKLLL
jgi:hypothetical protein